MKVRHWIRDTIALRHACTITMTILVAIAMTHFAGNFFGMWARPPLRESGMLERADDIVRMMDATPRNLREGLARAAASEMFDVSWYAPETSVAIMLGGASTPETTPRLLGFHFQGGPRRVTYFKAVDASPSLPKLDYDRADNPDTRFFAVALRDGSWVVFTVSAQLWGLPTSARAAILLGFLVLSVLVVSSVATLALTRPIKRFTQAVTRFGVDPRSSPMQKSGPRELRAAIEAFNAMQAQIQRFVDDRTAMLAAISHDLRTPLTRMRLRGELIDDGNQRVRHFRDVDDMQAMIDSALSFFRYEFQDEESTTFDLPELLRTIADDYSDQGIDVPYEGPDRAACAGRPFALKRALTNLVENAVKYAKFPEIKLRHEASRMCVTVRDQGPGIPAEAAERVFAPFYRLERSRNRATGGVGLGLASARAVVRGHGGDIALHARPGGGLDVEVCLPIIPMPKGAGKATYSSSAGGTGHRALVRRGGFVGLPSAS